MAALSAMDLHLFGEGTHCRLYDKLGAQLESEGVRFSVWAPNAKSVAVIGDFNQYRGERLVPLQSSGIWSGVIAGVELGDTYKFRIETADGRMIDKADPYARATECPPKTASVVAEPEHTWRDQDWMASRAQTEALSSPMSIYEMHIGSWRHTDGRPLTYRELTAPLVEHLSQMNFTHVEFLPVMEHPFGASWGYQSLGYFAPTARFGTPEDLMGLIDALHQAGIAVIFDWVPSHFPEDAHGLAQFDGTHLYEHADPRQGFHPDWKSAIFNYGRKEVQAFLLSSACYWLDKFHVDALRVDAVASMLYLDYSRQPGEWIPNRYGGRENLEAMDFLRNLNSRVYRDFPGVETIAEESTAWPMVSRPVELGGLGFGMKWDMGWMHDTLEYFAHDPVHRRYHHERLTFRGLYAHTENFVLPLSHDEVVHLKGSLYGKMPGDDWQKYAQLRLLYSYMHGVPGKKLLFMGAEVAQWSEWNHDATVEWPQPGDPREGVARCLSDLNRLHKQEAALHELDCEAAGFEWVDCSDSAQSVIAFLRKGTKGSQPILCVFNFTPVTRHDYRLGVPLPGEWQELMNTDSAIYGGSGQGNLGAVVAEPVSAHGHGQSLALTLPPLGAVFFVPAATSEDSPVSSTLRRP